MDMGGPDEHTRRTGFRGQAESGVRYGTCRQHTGRRIDHASAERLEPEIDYQSYHS